MCPLVHLAQRRACRLSAHKQVCGRQTLSMSRMGSTALTYGIAPNSFSPMRTSRITGTRCSAQTDLIYSHENTSITLYKPSASHYRYSRLVVLGRSEERSVGL